MKPGVIYRGLFENTQSTYDTNLPDGQNIIYSIYDEETLIDDAASETIIDLDFAGPSNLGDRVAPVSISTIDNEEDKFKNVIQAKQCEARIYTDDSLDLSTFATGGDRRWRVEVVVNDLDKIIFKGWLSLSDLEMEFQPHPNILILRAADALAMLRNIPLTDFDGEVPTGDHKIIEFIAWCLSKTGFDLPIFVYNNLREENNAYQWFTTAQFTGADTISVPLAYGKYFKAGQQFSISGSASNNGTFTVVSATLVPFVGYLIVVSETITTEAGGPTLTFTDVTNGGHIYSSCYLDSKTFEKEIGTTIDCYTVLQYILGEYCSLCQTKEAWYIVSEDERGPFATQRAEFTNEGEFVGYTFLAFHKDVGESNSLSWFGYPDTPPLVSPQSAHKSITETFNYSFPKESVCNIDFTRGDFIADLPDEVIEDETFTAKSYEIDCWEYLKTVPPETQDSTAYIKRLFNSNNYEKERFVHMPATAVSAFYYLRSTDRIKITIKDKFNFGLAFRYSTDLGGGSGSATLTQAWIRLYGNDGTYWNFHYDSSGTMYWKQSNSSWSTNQAFVQWTGLVENKDFTEWESLSFESLPVPVTGEIEILLINNQTSNSQDKDFSDVSFSWIPFINSGYGKVTGQSHTISQSLDTILTREEEVFISDAPRIYINGAIKIFNGTDYDLAGNFIHPITGDIKPYGEHQAWAVWNQFNRTMYKMEGVVDRIEADLLDSDDKPDLPDLIHEYFLTDNSNITQNGTQFRSWQLLSFEMDMNLCEWNAVFIEVYDTEFGKTYDDDHVFKYLT